jgi:hypothetical protein
VGKPEGKKRLGRPWHRWEDVIRIDLGEIDMRSINNLIALMMETVRTSETSVNFNVTTRRYIPGDSKLEIKIRIPVLIGYSYGVVSYKASQGLRPFPIYSASLPEF